jgi:hypothetical protein
MAPKKKKSATSESQGQEGDSRCIWMPEDERQLITYIKDNRAKGSDGLNFDKQFWHQVAAHLAPTTTSSVVKTGDACSTRWSHVSLSSIYRHSY